MIIDFIREHRLLSNAILIEFKFNHVFIMQINLVHTCIIIYLLFNCTILNYLGV